MSINKQINILVLCATNESASLNPTRLQNNIDYLIQNNFTKPNAKNQPIQQLYYMGDTLTHNLQNNKCKAVVDNLLIACDYSEKMFDIILSEYCPLRTTISVFNNIFFNNVIYLLKDNGIISWKEDKYGWYTVKVPMDGNKQISEIKYTYDAFYNMLDNKYHLIYNDVYIVKSNMSYDEKWCIIKKGSQINTLNKATVANPQQPIGTNTAESQLLVHPKGGGVMDSRSSIGMYDKSAPHGMAPPIHFINYKNM